MRSKAVFIVGERGSGKTTASKNLERLGWRIVSAGDVIREMCIKKGLPTDRETLQNYGEYYLKKYRYKALANKLYKEAQGNEMVIYEGIRPIEVVQLLRRKYMDSIIIYLEANRTIREKRVREKYHNQKTSLNQLNNHPIEILVTRIQKIADYVIGNNGSITDFYRKIHEIITKF